MSIRTVVVLLLCIVGIVFVAVNWTGIIAPVPVNFLFKEVNAPLGLILLGVLGVLLIACFLWSFMQQAAVLVDIRRAYKEARTNKQLAENAEQSRIQNSTKTLTQEFTELSGKLSASVTASTEKTTKSLEVLTADVTALKSQLALLDAKMMKIAETNGITLPTEEPKPEPAKSRFFGLFGSKASDVKEATPKAVEEKPAASAINKEEKPQETK